MYFFLSNLVAKNSVAENVTPALHSWKRNYVRTQESKFRLTKILHVVS